MSTSDFAQSQMDQAMDRELVAHAEALKAAIEGGYCLKCRRDYHVELLPRAIRFYCDGYRRTGKPCGWQALYPIARVGNSDPVRHFASILVTNAELTVIDCYKVPLDDLEALRVALEAK